MLAKEALDEVGEEAEFHKKVEEIQQHRLRKRSTKLEAEAEEDDAADDADDEAEEPAKKQRIN